MNHQKKGKKFGRKKNERNALMQGLVRSLFKFGRIETTLARAKESRRYAERLVSVAKKDTIASRRTVNKWLDKKETDKLFSELVPKYQDRNGGYTRVVRSGLRSHDRAEKAIIEFV